LIQLAIAYASGQDARQARESKVTWSSVCMICHVADRTRLTSAGYLLWRTDP
jgi:cytochrome c553